MSQPLMWTISATVEDHEKAFLADVAASLRAVESPLVDGPDEVCDFAAKTFNAIAEAESAQVCIDGSLILRKLLSANSVDLSEHATAALKEACVKAWPALGPLALHPDPVVQSHALFVLRTFFPLVVSTVVESDFVSLLAKCARTLPLHRTELLLRVVETAIHMVPAELAAKTSGGSGGRISGAIFDRFSAFDETVAVPWPLVAAAGRLAFGLATGYADVVKPLRAKSRSFDPTTVIDDSWVRPLVVFATSALAAYAGFCDARPTMAVKQGAEIATIANALSLSIIHLSAERHLAELRVMSTVAAFLKGLRPAFSAAAEANKPFAATVAASALWDVVREGVRKNVSQLEKLVEGGLLSLSLDFVAEHGDAGCVAPAVWTISIFQLDRKLSTQMLRAGALSKMLPLIHHTDPVTRSLSAFIISDYACCTVPSAKSAITEADAAPEPVARALEMSVSEMNELRSIIAAVLTFDAICEIITYCVTLVPTKSSQDSATRELRGFATLVAAAIATAPPSVQDAVFKQCIDELRLLDVLVRDSPFKSHVISPTHHIGALLQCVPENVAIPVTNLNCLYPARMNRIVMCSSGVFRTLWQGVKLPKGVVA